MSTENRKPSLDILYRLANNVKRHREARGLTQEALAIRCGFSKGYLSNVEQGTVNVTLATLERLASGLGCSESDLLRRYSGT